VQSRDYGRPKEGDLDRLYMVSKREKTAGEGKTVGR
jgi:hypothetical protein